MRFLQVTEKGDMGGGLAIAYRFLYASEDGLG